MSSEVEVKVRVGCGRWRVFRVSARYARVVLVWSVEGNRAYYGYRANVGIKIGLHNSSEVDRAKINLRIYRRAGAGREVVYEDVLSVDRWDIGAARIRVPLGVGDYSLSAYIVEPEPLKGRIVSFVGGDSFKVSIIPPSLNIVRVKSGLYYPKGGELVFEAGITPGDYEVSNIYLSYRDRRIPCTIIQRNRSGGYIFKCEDNMLSGDKSDYKIIDGKPYKEYRVVGELSYKDRVFRVEEALSARVMLDPGYKSQLEDRIRRYVEKAFSDSETSITSIIDEVRSLLDECRVARLFNGLDCRLLDDVLERLRGEIRELDSKSSRISRNIKEKRFTDAILEYLELYEKCGMKRYSSLRVCGKRGLYNLGKDLLEKVSQEAQRLLDSSRIREAQDLYMQAVRICDLEIPGTGKACGTIMGLGKMIEDIVGLLSKGLRVELPGQVYTRRIKARITVEYEGSSILEGVYIDFSPAEDYIVPQEGEWRVKIPRLYPGMILNTDTVLKAKFQGRISIPYKKCYREYCIEENQLVTIRIGGETAPSIMLDRSLYIGQPIPELAQLNPRPVRAAMLGEVIRLGEYECTGLLGRGGFAVALYCTHTRTGSRAVAKIPLEAYIALETGRREVPSTCQ